MGTKLPHPILFCFYHPRHCERESIPAQPSSGRPRVLAHPLDGQTPTTAKSVQPLPNPRPPAPGSPPLSAPSDLAAPQFRKHLLQPPVSQILASLPPFSATHPFPARPGCRLRDSHCEAQAPRERPERSLRMAGSDTGLPGSFRGNGGWRPLKRDQSRPAESAELGGGEARSELVSQSLSPVVLLIPLPWGLSRVVTPPGSARLGLSWLPRLLPQSG